MDIYAYMNRRGCRVTPLRLVDDILADDDQKEKKMKANVENPCVELDLGKPIHRVLRANLLSPNLVKRFKGCRTSSSLRLN